MTKQDEAMGEAVRAAMEVSGLKWRRGEDGDSPELTAALNDAVLRWITAELEAGKLTQEEFEQAAATLREGGWRPVLPVAAAALFRE